MKTLLLLPVLVAPLAAKPADPAQAVLEAAKARAAAVAKARTAWVEAGKPSSEFRADLSKDIARAGARLAKEKRPAVRRALMVSRLLFRRLGRELPTSAELADVRREVPPTDPAWSVDFNLLAALGTWDAKAFGPYLEQARAAHPDGALRRYLLLNHFTDMIDTSAEKDWRPSYAMLLKDFPDSSEAAKARERLDSEALTAVGAPAPAFDLPSLEDPAQRLTPATFKGSYVLVDFWASWCPDCVREMPGMHKAWARFQGRNFQILSLSLDRKVEHIARYRAVGETPMPWRHAFLEGGWKSPVCAAWGVKSIPKPVLVGPDGRIVASGADLRGENLEATLAKFLEN